MSNDNSAAAIPIAMVMLALLAIPSYKFLIELLIMWIIFKSGLHFLCLLNKRRT